MAVFAADTFDRSDRILNGDTASDGGTWGSVSGYGNLQIVSSKARTVDGGANFVWHSGVPGSSEYVVSGTYTYVSPSGGTTRLGFGGRLVKTASSFSGYYFRYEGYQQRWELYRANGDGTFTVLDSLSEVPANGTSGLLELDISNTAKSGSWGGVQKCTSPDNSLTDIGQVGIYAYGGSGGSSGSYCGTLDDFSAATAGGSTTPVASDSTLAWNIRQIIGAASTAQWNMLKNVAAQSTHLWQLRALVESDSSLQWSTLAQVNQSATTIWNALQQVNADSDQRWAVRELVASDGTLVWDLTRMVGQGATVVWNVESATGTVGTTLTARWSLLQAISSQLQIDWSLLQAVGIDQTTMWGVLEGVVQAIDARWDVHNGVSQSATIQWNGIGLVGEAVTMRWEVSAGGVSSPVLAIVIPSEARTIIIPDDGREIVIKADQPLH